MVKRKLIYLFCILFICISFVYGTTDSVSDILEQGATKIYTLNDKTYEIEVISIHSEGSNAKVKFKINGKLTNSLEDEESYTENDWKIYVKEILSEEAGEVDVDKVEFEYTVFEKSYASFTGDFLDYGYDKDGNGLYDYLTIETKVNTSKAGEYKIVYRVNFPNGKSKSYRQYSNLKIGLNPIYLNFSVLEFYNIKTNGTFILEYLRLYDDHKEDPILLDQKEPDTYTTSFYNYEDFEKPSLEVTGNFSDYGTDLDGNGLYDYLTIRVPINVTEAGEFEINAELRPSGAEIRINILLNISDKYIYLNFQGYEIYKENKSGINILEYFSISQNKIKIYRMEGEYETNNSYNYEDFERPSLEVIENFSDYGFDLDGNGLYDYLTIKVPVNVTKAGEFKIKARIEPSYTVFETNISLNISDKYIYLNFLGIDIYKQNQSGIYILERFYIYQKKEIYDMDDEYETKNSYNYEDFEHEINYPPEIIAISTVPEPIKLNDTIHFGVEVSDENNNDLIATWYVDGEKVMNRTYKPVEEETDEEEPVEQEPVEEVIIEVNESEIIEDESPSYRNTTPVVNGTPFIITPILQNIYYLYLANQSGDHEIKVNISDGEFETWETWSIYVKETPKVCIPSWVQDNNPCLINNQKLITYTDINNCNSTKEEETNVIEVIVEIPEDNNTYTSCDYCSPLWETVYGECFINETRTVSYSYTNNCCADTGFESDCTIPSNKIEFCTYSKLGINNIKVKVDKKKDKNINEGETISKDAKPGSEVKFDIEVENLFTREEDIDIEDIEITVTIEDIDDGDDLKEESDEFDLSANKDKGKKIIFNIPYEVEEDSYDVIIDIRGKDENKIIHEIEWEIKLDVKKEKYNLKIMKSELKEDTISCGQTSSLSMNILNLGSKDEEEVKLIINNEELNLFYEKIFELEEFPDNNAEYTNNFEIKGRGKKGIYPISIQVYSELDNLMDEKTLTLVETACKNKSCTDSDGRDFWNKGEVITQEANYLDECRDDQKIVEYTCNGDNIKKYIGICPYKCSNGACITKSEITVLKRNDPPIKVPIKKKTCFAFWCW
jgi:hypothetical protein